jgi:hypothetical protein
MDNYKYIRKCHSKSSGSSWKSMDIRCFPMLARLCVKDLPFECHVGMDRQRYYFEVVDTFYFVPKHYSSSSVLEVRSTGVLSSSEG